jgi:hypothetical protein
MSASPYPQAGLPFIFDPGQRAVDKYDALKQNFVGTLLHDEPLTTCGVFRKDGRMSLNGAQAAALYSTQQQQKGGKQAKVTLGVWPTAELVAKLACVHATVAEQVLRHSVGELKPLVGSSGVVSLKCEFGPSPTPRFRHPGTVVHGDLAGLTGATPIWAVVSLGRITAGPDKVPGLELVVRHFYLGAPPPARTPVMNYPAAPAPPAPPPLAPGPPPPPAGGDSDEVAALQARVAELEDMLTGEEPPAAKRVRIE